MLSPCCCHLNAVLQWRFSHRRHPHFDFALLVHTEANKANVLLLQTVPTCYDALKSTLETLFVWSVACLANRRVDASIHTSVDSTL